jgi:BirA family biotin operon repressor/biotin-[acetyl-CoA-carboxylase] ligase
VKPELLPEDVRTAVQRAGARLGVCAGPLIWYSSVPSTNDLAAQMADGGAPEGTVVSADAQSAGRGRLGRTWASPAGAGLYTSVILRPPAPALALLSIGAGVAIAEGIEAAAGLRSTVKWPNDIYAGTRKLAGILAEAGSTASGAHHAIVGFGVNLMPAAYPPDVAARATSIESELGRAVDRGLVLAECLAALSMRYRDLREGRAGAVIASWRERAGWTFGRHIEWDSPAGMRQGVAEDIDETGALLVRSEGSRLRIISGEVRWTS